MDKEILNYENKKTYKTTKKYVDMNTNCSKRGKNNVKLLTRNYMLNSDREIYIQKHKNDNIHKYTTVPNNVHKKINNMIYKMEKDDFNGCDVFSYWTYNLSPSNKQLIIQKEIYSDENKSDIVRVETYKANL